MAVDSRPRVLCMMDQAGWCFEQTANLLAMKLNEEFHFEIRLTKNVVDNPSLTADLLIVFNWPSLTHINKRKRRFGKIIAGVFDHWSIEAYQSLKFFELIREKADAMVVVNQDLQRRIAPHLSIPVFLAEDGVDCERFQPLDFPTKVVFGWCGNSAFAPPWAKIADGKGIQLLQEAGRQAGASLHLADTQFSSAIPNACMADQYYRQISVYISASVSEGTPLPMLEALACGRPVITTDVGLAPRTIQQGVNGLIIPRDVDQLALAMRRFLSQELRPERMAAACRRSALLHDWSLKSVPWRHCLKSLI